MNVKECYEKLGANYDEVSGRLPNEALVERFLNKFLSDESMNRLKAAVEEGNIEQSFMMVHTLKGVSQNLSLTRLSEAASALTEQLRTKTEPADATLYQAVLDEYNRTVDIIKSFS
ncbi:MAG: Hpt domain-containing protein [Lachnospiraceae bacterium]|nr:Hpt domain-containing protein [Lachnospiraceae bacterium]